MGGCLGLACCQSPALMEASVTAVINHKGKDRLKWRLARGLCPVYLGLSPLWAVEAEDPGSGSISVATVLCDLQGAPALLET